MKFKDNNTNYIDIEIGNKELEKSEQITKRSNKLLEEDVEDRSDFSSDTNGNSEEESNDDEVEDIKQMGTPQMPTPPKKDIQCITIIGEIEGHFVGNPQKKSTKYEHIIPMLYAVEENPDVKGVLVILNTVGGDVEAGLAMAELLNSVSKKIVTLVLGGSHSIGVPLATAGDYSFIAPTATMIVHPIRTNGLVIGVNETFEYFKKMQERIVEFIIRTSKIERDELLRLMHEKDELVSDVGSVLIGKEAVDCGLIDAVGGLKDALAKLKELIAEDEKITK